jgi:hypothetical protein
VTIYLDQTVTLTGIAYQYNFPKDHTCYVAISNESQGALTVQFYTISGAAALPPVNIAAGQPWVSQVEFYMISVTGVSGGVFNLKIQDDPLDLGQSQTHSSTIVYSGFYTQDNLAAGNYTVCTNPTTSGQHWLVEGGSLTYSGGSASNEVSLIIHNPGGGVRTIANFTDATSLGTVYIGVSNIVPFGGGTGEFTNVGTTTGWIQMAQPCNVYPGESLIAVFAGSAAFYGYAFSISEMPL